MKRVGIIGGIAPESTVDYYRRIIARYRERSDGASALILINSVDMIRLISAISDGRHDDVVAFLCDEIGRLERAGAEFAILSSNTPHVVFDELQRRSPLPLISIVEATAQSAVARGFKRVGLFATGFTMRAGFYPRVFASHGITVVPPTEDEQQTIHARYVGELVDGRFTGELVNGIFRDETRAELRAIARRMAGADGIEALILGGTELPLLMRDDGEMDLPLLDTTAIHVERIVDRLLT